MDGGSRRPRRRTIVRLGAGLLATGLAGCQLFEAESRRTVTPVAVDGVRDAAAPEAVVSGDSPADPDFRFPERLVPTEAGNGTRFGAAVDRDGDTALVGAPRQAVDGDVTGAAFVFRRRAGGWAQTATLRPAAPSPWAAFGAAVSLDGSTALVGAPRAERSDATRSGRCLVFERTDQRWTRAGTLRPGDGQQEAFATAVELDGETALIGARPIHRVAAPLSGSAYVFERSGGGWSQRAELEPGDGDGRDVFGYSIAIHGDRALVGAPRNLRREGDEDRPGAVYAFARGADDWTQTAALRLDGGDHGDAFGESVALQGGVAVVGAPAVEHPTGARGGAVAVLERSGESWRTSARLQPFDGVDGARFANATAVDGETVLVGAPADDNGNGEAAGAVYLVDRRMGTWKLAAKARVADGDPGDRFGQAVALDEGSGLIGATGDVVPETKTRSGTATVLRLSDDGR
jgi:hypothetical protein